MAARNVFSVIFGTAALEGAAIAALFDQVSHGTVGASAMFTRLMTGRGMPCAKVRDGAVVLKDKAPVLAAPNKANWVAYLGTLTPKGAGRETRATLPTFAAAVVALMNGDRTLADTFDADEAASWATYQAECKVRREADAAARAAVALANAASTSAASVAASAAPAEAPAEATVLAALADGGVFLGTIEVEGAGQGESHTAPQVSPIDDALTLLEGAIRAHVLTPSQVARMVALVAMLQPSTTEA